MSLGKIVSLKQCGQHIGLPSQYRWFLKLDYCHTIMMLGEHWSDTLVDIFHEKPHDDSSPRQYALDHNVMVQDTESGNE